MSGPTAHSPRSILVRLKAETVAEHRRIEQAINLPRAMSSVARYAALLQGFYGFYAPFEELLLETDGRDRLGIDLTSRLKCHLLAEDLKSLGAFGSNVPLCDDLPGLTTTSSVWGSMYVLEGSTLGGQIISRMIEKTLGISRETGGRFFQGYGPRTGEMWTEFGAALTTNAHDSSSHEMIINAAQETFQKLRSWLERLSINDE